MSFWDFTADPVSCGAGEVTDAMIQWLMLAEEPMLEHKFARFVALGLGFLFLGQQEAVEATLEVARSVHERIAKVAAVLLDTCAHAGTGNVLKVQEMLSICGETIDAEEGAEWKVRHAAHRQQHCSELRPQLPVLRCNTVTFAPAVFG